MSEELRAPIFADRLFDAKWYGKKYKKNFENDAKALDFFLYEGAFQQHAPNALFDPAFYRHNNMSSSDDSPAFFHYLTFGADKSASPHPLVDVAFVAEQLARRNSSEFPMSALLHKCAAYSLDPHPLFSTSFYLSNNPELKLRRTHPIIHFLENGGKEGRLAHPLFWPRWIEAEKGRVASSIPLLTYVQDPDWFRLFPCAYFDTDFYLTANPDIKSINPLYHFLRFGQYEGRSPNINLDGVFVSTTYSLQLKKVGLDPLSFVILSDKSYVRANAKAQSLKTVGTPKQRTVEWPRPISEVTKSKRRRLAYVSHNLKVQGAQTSLFELSVGMKYNYGHEVSILAPDEGPMKFRYSAEAMTVLKYFLPLHGLANEIEYKKLSSTFEDQIDALRPEIIHGNTIQCYHAVALAARRGIPAVWNIRESESPLSHGGEYLPAARDLLAEALASKPHFVFVSATTEALWRQYFPNMASSIIPNGIDYSRLTLSFRQSTREAARTAWGVRDDELLILSVGTWTERKGQEDIVPALGRLDRRFWPQLRLLMLGATDTPYGQRIRDNISALAGGLRARIDVAAETAGLAERARVLQAYAAADLFVFTSRIESYPRVINEAMNFGLPIIATPCFGVVEQLESGFSAHFYEPGDVEALSRLIRRLLVDVEERKRIGANARWASRHKVMQYKNMLARYEQVYSQIMN